jgi:hypothetical protein
MYVCMYVCMYYVCMYVFFNMIYCMLHHVCMYVGRYVGTYVRTYSLSLEQQTVTVSLNSAYLSCCMLDCSIISTLLGLPVKFTLILPVRYVEYSGVFSVHCTDGALNIRLVTLMC